jgi:hypothetical protein
VSFIRDNRRKFDPGRALFTLPRFAVSPMMRVVLLAVVGILGAAWALAYHATATMPPLRVPVEPKPAPTYDADAGEIPVPDFYLQDGG